MQVFISGQLVTTHHGTFTADNAIGQRSTCQFLVYDTTGNSHFQQGEPVIVLDNSGNLIYGGEVDNAVEQQTTQGALIEYNTTCADWHYLADKRVAATSYTNQSVGYITNDLLTNFLAAEGVYAILNTLSPNQSNIATNTTGFSNNVGTMTRVSTTFAYGFVASLKFITTSAGDNNITVLGATTLGSQNNLWAVTPGAPYQFSAYALSDGTAGVRLKIISYDSGGNFIAHYFSAYNSTNAWERLNLQYTAESNAAGVLLLLENDSAFGSMWFDGLQWEPNQFLSPWETGQTSSIQAGPTLPAFTSNYATVAQCYDSLAEQATFYWQIDLQKRLWMALPGTQTAPQTADWSLMARDNTQVTNSNPQYRNRQFILGGTDVTAAQTESRKGDGTTRAFTMSYALSAAPSSVKVDGTTQTVGVKGVDTGKNFYYAIGDPVLAQDTSGTVLATTDTLAVTYTGIYPIVALSADNGAVASQQAIEGGLTTGYVEAMVEDPTITSASQAFMVAAGKLARFAVQGKQIVFTTSTPGFAQGQLATVNIPSHNINNVQALIESVHIADTGPLSNELVELWYTVTAVIGPYDTTWVQFFSALANAKPTQNQVNVGSSQTLVILESVSESWSWTESVAETINVCSFPATTLYPATSGLYPC